MSELFTLTPTHDGSLTLFDAGTHQHYHNRAGAYTEALKNYVLPSGILEQALQQDTIHVLDACYGLGYNSWVLLEAILAQRTQKQITRPLHISIDAIEANPALFSLTEALLQQSCYPGIQTYSNAPLTECTGFFTGLSKISKTTASAQFSYIDNTTVEWRVYLQDLRKTVPSLPSNTYDLIFHDPFSPNKMPELWTVDLFRRYHECLNASGRLLTYSLASAVRAGFLEAGFTLYKSEGVGDKPGGTIAFKRQPSRVDSLLPAFTDDERQQLESRAGIPYRDAELNQPPDAILQAREAEQAQSKRKSSSELKKAVQTI